MNERQEFYELSRLGAMLRNRFLIITIIRVFVCIVK